MVVVYGNDKVWKCENVEIPFCATVLTIQFLARFEFVAILNTKFLP